MKKILLSSVALCALSTVAVAADLPSRSAPALAPVTAFSWTGAYVGVTAGYLSQNTKSTVTDWDSVTVEDESSKSKGSFVYGATFGYNHQFANRVVLGLETDFSMTSNTAGNYYPNYWGGSDSSEWTSKQTSFGTVRVRLGYAAFDRTMVYATGGLAYGNFKTAGSVYNNLANSSATCRQGFNSLQTGWTVGAGLEHALTNNLTVKVEALYAKFNKSQTAAACCGCRFGFKSANTVVRAGVNYKF